VQLNDTQNTALSPSDINTFINHLKIMHCYRDHWQHLLSVAFKPMLSENRVYIFDETAVKDAAEEIEILSPVCKKFADSSLITANNCLVLFSYC
jgi:hypothetical protein